ncbi:MAG: hypothetical protein AB1414_03760 [bacterium]
MEDKVTGLLKIVVQLYTPIATWRCKKRLYNWMPEMTLMRMIRAFKRS